MNSVLIQEKKYEKKFIDYFIQYWFINCWWGPEWLTKRNQKKEPKKQQGYVVQEENIGFFGSVFTIGHLGAILTLWWKKADPKDGDQ